MSNVPNDTNALLQEMMAMLKTSGNTTKEIMDAMTGIGERLNKLETTVVEQNNELRNLKTTVAEQNNELRSLKTTVAEQNNELDDVKEQLHRREIADKYRDGLKATEDAKKTFPEIIADTESTMSRYIKDVSDDKSNDPQVKIALKDPKTGEFYTVNEKKEKIPVTPNPDSPIQTALATGRPQNFAQNDVSSLGIDGFEKKNHNKIELIRRDKKIVGFACISSNEPIELDARRVCDVGVNHLAQTIDIKLNDMEKAELEKAVELTEQKSKHYQEKAEIDPLTKMHTINGIKSGLVNNILPALKDGKDVSVVFADADGFKSINDNISHAAGDAILKNIANSCRTTTIESGDFDRKGDIPYRIGGDEMGIIVVGAEKDAKTLADRTNHIALNSDITYTGDKDINLADITLHPGDTIKAGDIPVANKRDGGRVDGSCKFGMSMGISSFTEDEKAKFIEIGNQLKTDEKGNYVIDENYDKCVEKMYAIWNDGPRARADTYASNAKKAGKNRIFTAEENQKFEESVVKNSRISNPASQHAVDTVTTTADDKNRTLAD